MLKNWSKIGMRRSGKTENRPEQYKLAEYFAKIHPECTIELEYKVFSTDGALIAKIDVADVTGKVAYRLRSAFSYHDSRRQELLGALQKERLEKRGWIVVDITQDSDWSWLWN